MLSGILADNKPTFFAVNGGEEMEIALVLQLYAGVFNFGPSSSKLLFADLDLGKSPKTPNSC